MSEDKELYKAGNETGFKFDLRNDFVEFNNANLTYHDAEGNEISRERYYELKVDKLEDRVLSLESEISSLYELISNKADALNIVNAINCSPEDIRIKGDKIEIDRNTLIEHGILNK